MANSQFFVDQAMELREAAIAAENAKVFRLALDKYRSSCQALSFAMKYESNSETKAKNKEILTDMLNRADEIEKQLPQLEKGKVPPKTDEKKSKSKGSGHDGENKELKDALEGAIVREKPNVKWDDVAGLDNAKQSLSEAAILPIKFPDLFVGERKPWKGILLYGPPGTGKSFLAKAVATEVDATFFSISSSDLISKWIGESERLVRSLFEMARENKPSIVFIDEIDSIAGKRGEYDSNAHRGVKTELLVQMQGVGTQNDGILFLGATNRPWDLDSAVIRRFEKRILITLPDANARKEMFRIHLGKTPNTLTDEDFRILGEKSEGFSGSDVSIVVRDALMQPIRQLQKTTHFKKCPITEDDGTTTEKWVGVSASEPGAVAMNLMSIPPNELHTPPVTMEHMLSSLKHTRPSVSPRDVAECDKWTKEYGIQG
ncbi:Vacuolar protein sorting 4E (Vps4E) [Monocercomonoides exilis]|uniref:Vacuolar protein sorting 4E (Vps4E) n=1 Tax=Monocercomonoides exilis TaxID=2049356 RepID=UPI003559493F|nr:Vacuolar protein sorting 4E (Vps4E) [Monocercomonoides exilis]|eukprot:MONOS_6453.1-p1 / transcript=MONOS_6453.1 / gene=MONOS_6453 / organism=Monocercomonoides_exilis_PA203 / gene_product= Vacuolar protein sorting 4E (Vps4E) / transcript_product= Vacuolar protein sorting 4E (Vps4E) / location=Mono_scaffold00203:36523-38423(-) / protein_length=431 / sequence_SO=supercontig / SO=protein_coding / is_pseudo=false